MTHSVPKLGIITTGQGPRPEYEAYHRQLFAALGMTIEVESFHMLDDLAWSDIAPHISGCDQVVLGAYVRLEGATGPTLPNGATHIYYDIEWAAERVQAGIDALLTRGVQMIIFCASAPLPLARIVSPVPFLLPSDVLLTIADDHARLSQKPLDIGLLTTAGHGDLDVQHWESMNFAKAPVIHNAVFEGDPLGAARQLADRPLDLTVLWSYGWGLNPNSDISLSAALEDLLGCTVLMPHRVTALRAAGILRCGFDDRVFVS